MLKRLLVLALLCFPLPSAYAAARTCRSIAGSAAILQPGARVLFGEMHGNNETPALIGDVACAAGLAGPVRIGLEISVDEQPRIDRFLSSSGDDAARTALLTGPFWRRDFQDGRSSVAMLALLDTLRVQRHAGADLKVVAFDGPAKGASSDRDLDMAQRLAAAFDREPSVTFLVLVGNLHARKAPHPRFPQQFMAQYLRDRFHESPLTLDVRYGAGTSWVCTPECGVHRIGRDPAPPVGIELQPTSDHAYDGTFSIGVPTAAPPAWRPE